MAKGSYTVDKLIGLTIRAKSPTAYYNIPTYMDNPIKLGTVKTGDIIGVVDSWTGGEAGRPLHLQFKRLNGSVYYVPLLPGMMDNEFNRAQGLTTTQEDIQAKAEEDKSTLDKFLDTLTGGASKVGKYILIGGAALIALNIILKNRK